MGEQGALRQPGRAAGVEDDGRVPGVAGLVRRQRLGVAGQLVEGDERDAGRLGRRGAHLGERRVREEQLGPGVAQHVPDLPAAEQGGDGDDDAPGGDDPVVGGDELGDVRRQQRDPAPGPDTALPQGAGGLEGQPPQGRVVGAALALDDGGVRRSAAGGLGQDGREGEGRHPEVLGVGGRWGRVDAAAVPRTPGDVVEQAAVDRTWSPRLRSTGVRTGREVPAGPGRCGRRTGRRSRRQPAAGMPFSGGASDAPEASGVISASPRSVVRTSVCASPTPPWSSTIFIPDRPRWLSAE